MFGIDDAVNTGLQVLGKVIDRAFPDPAEKARAQAALEQMRQAGELDDMRVRMGAILAEAQSVDPYTSRARPSLFYCMYLLILWSIPMGIVAAVSPNTAGAIGAGMQAYLGAIPDGLWTLFISGFLGYSGLRTWEKTKGVTK